jgi:ArsR family transcriptional regulator, arsenate/arsenite/antimonite-responsive transcriptional repressor
MEATLGRPAAIIRASLTRGALTADQAEAAAGLFKALAEPVRLRLLSLVASHANGEASVSELAAFFDVTQSNISHHLKALRGAGLIIARKSPPWTYYRIDPQSLLNLSRLLDPSREPPPPPEREVGLEGDATTP